MYNPERARFALPISINLVSNAVLKTVFGGDHGIDLSYGELSLFKDNSTFGNAINWMHIGYIVAVILAFFIFPAVSLFVVHPLRERLSNVKHLQRIAGVSATAYWGIIFAFDFVIFLVISVLFVAKFVLTDFLFNLHLFEWQETCKFEVSICFLFKNIQLYLIFCFSVIQLLLFILFAINVLPFVYIFSFRKKSPSATIVLLSILPICLGKQNKNMKQTLYYTV